VLGDTLFVGGCGRFFEGTGKDMLDVVEKLEKLDPSTRIYPGHEYSLNNLR
jgi:hydroxyacylglutathione hydrolase